MAHGPIVLVGGLASWPRRYRGFAQILREISGSEVHVAPITPLDWLLGRLRGYGQLVFEVASAVDRALLESDSGKVVLVGHSAGGIACRVYVGGDPPYGGRRYSGHRRVSHLITLGSPHVVADKKSLAPIAQVNDLFPGALHEPPDRRRGRARGVGSAPRLGNICLRRPLPQRVFRTVVRFRPGYDRAVVARGAAREQLLCEGASCIVVSEPETA
jgi:pimeloyl-ACP methyl ester carboxylesterase